MRVARGKRLLAVAALTAFFATAVAAGAAGTILAPYRAIPVGSWPEAVAVGDVTGDGRGDVVMTTSFYFDPPNDYRLWVFAQAADGTLSTPVSYATAATYGNRPKSVAVGDITGDGAADVVVGISGLGVQVFPQLPGGSLDAPRMTSTVDSDKVRLGHLNADSALDVAGVGWGTNTVSVLLNDRAGGLRAPVVHAARHGGYDDLEVGDVTADGRDDLVVMSGQSYAVPNVSVLPQLLGGGVGPAGEYRVEDDVNTQGIGVGDVNGDGRNDVVASFGGNQPLSRLALFLQNADGTLDAPPVVYASYDVPEPVEIADLERDGAPDIVTLHGGWSRAGVYLHEPPDGALGGEDLYPIPYASHYDPHGLAVGDVNGDGYPDVVLADYNNGLVVLYNALDAPPSPPPPPPRPPSADLAVDLTASATKVKPKKSFSFDVRVANRGPDASATSLVVSLSGPASGLAASTAECTVNALTVRCSFTTLAANSDRTLQIYGTAGTKGTIVASAEVDAAEADPDAGNDTDSATIQVR